MIILKGRKMPASSRVVLCMKWGTLFPAGYVNVLFNACRKHIKGEFRFVCLTDDATGFVAGIESFPIPDIGCLPMHWKNGAWPKLSVFVKDLYGLRGRALFIDLDTVVTGSLDAFFEEDGDFLAVGAGQDWGKAGTNTKPTANTSIFGFDLGGQSQIVDAYVASREAAFSEFEIEQRFAEHYATSWRPWPDEWIVSFKRHLRRAVIVDRFLAPRLPGPEVRVVAFHGRPRPIDLIRPGSYNWDRFPHFGRGPVSWVRNYWLENGYRDPE